MNKTPIQWTDFTVNPFRFRNLETGKVGHHCTKISPGCAHCYSAKMQTGPYLSGLDFIVENKPKGEFFLDEAALQQVLRRRKPGRIFWADMTDMFLEDYPDAWIDRCFAVMALTPHLTHQVLTKRADRIREYFAGHDARRRVQDVLAPIGNRTSPEAARLFDAWPLPNVWLGVSVEDQQRADERIPLLLQTPAAVRFLSVEPLLGPVDLHTLPFPFGRGQFSGLAGVVHNGLPGVDWVIVGGESGPNSRPCDVAWIRSIVQQCKAAAVPVFVKQLGANAIEHGFSHVALKDPKGGDINEFPEDVRVREMPCL